MEKISIIIPTHNNMAMLISCIQEITRTAQLPHEIIVVANGCTDDTVSVIRAMGHSVVDLVENKGFGAGCNEGARAATGTMFVFLNDDTLPGPTWLSRMYNCFRLFNKKNPHFAPVGAVGPTSNYVAGRQLLRIDPQTTPPRTPLNIRETVEGLQPGLWEATGFLSGFCLMTPKSVFDEIGGFDEEFFAGCEDNAYCLSAQLAGYCLVIAADSYVFHHGSQTLVRDEFLHLNKGTKDLSKFYDKYRVKGPQKLAALYRVKIEDEFFSDILDKSLARSANFADGVFILDDGSPYDIKPLVEKYKDKVVKYERFERELGEKRDRNTLYTWAQEAGFDWVFSIDADEIVEDKVTREYMDKLMHPYHPEVFNYWVHFYTFWDSPEYVRADDVWASMSGPRIGRVLKNKSIGTSIQADFHNGNIPIREIENTLMTSIRMKHYGYLRQKDRARKYAWYTKNDPNPDPRLVGHKDYNHLIQEDNIRVSKWREDNTLGVATIMKNEEDVLPNFLKTMLPFMDEIVIADTGSTDRSIEIATAAGCKVVHGPDVEDFSKWRNTALKNCNTSWAIHVDIDEQFDNISAIRRICEDYSTDGFVFYVKNFMPDGMYTISETVRLMRDPKRWYYTGYVHETTDDCMAKLRLKITRSPIYVHHFGYFRKRLPDKFKKYVKLNRKQMHDFPKDARPVFNLAMHYLEEPGYYEEGLELLKKSCELNPRFYSPRKELMLHTLRQALQHAHTLQQVLPPDHMFHSLATEIIQTLSKWIQPQRRLAPGHLDEASGGDSPVQEISGPGNGSRTALPPSGKGVSKRTSRSESRATA